MGKVEQAYENEMTDKTDEVFEGVQGERLPLGWAQNFLEICTYDIAACGGDDSFL